MAFLEYNNIRIAGIAATVPTTVIDNLNYTDFMTQAEAESVIKMTGIRQRRFADKEVCSSDLCFKAAENLFGELQFDRKDIDAIIMVTLTPDYRMPATAFLLHKRLKLKRECLAFDLTLGCSGYINGLVMAFNLLQQNDIRHVLLLNGETKSKTYGKRDKSTSLLFGDGGTVTLLSKTDKPIYTAATLNSDGSRWQTIQIPAGGYRNPTSLQTLTETLQEDGNWRSREQGYMDGPGVFDFTITEVPKDILNLFSKANSDPGMADYFIFHQANKFITEHIRKKLKIAPDKVLYSLDRYGNTASVSIPLTICSELAGIEAGKPIITCLSAFGVGLSWGSILIDLQGCRILPVTEY